jgi:hypothetical protein
VRPARWPCWPRTRRRGSSTCSDGETFAAAANTQVGGVWSWHHIAALAWGGLLERTLVGFVAPIPAGVSGSGKVLHGVVLLSLVLLVGVLVRRRLTR